MAAVYNNDDDDNSKYFLWHGEKKYKIQTNLERDYCFFFFCRLSQTGVFVYYFYFDKIFIHVLVMIVLVFITVCHPAAIVVFTRLVV